VVGFKSYCGGLPAPDAKTTPWGYKFSWSPRGVVLAGTNSARYLKDGEVVEIPGKDLFGHSWEVDVPEARTFEAYPNRDSLPYKDLYGLGDAKTMLRGTLRYPGWCETWKAMVDLGLLSLEERDDLGGQTYRELMASLVPGAEVGSVEKDVADHLGIDMESEPMLRWRWLGLFSDDKVDPEPTLLDVLSHRLLQKLEYGPGERDMIVLHHDFDVELADGKKKITSSLIDYGVPGGDSAMSRTVSLPAAIAVRLVLEGKLDVVGVHIPVKRSIYEPVLEELETLGIRCREEEQPA
jgi:saccharopine dehydrogenase-like NADP-dependent oxidoreductase